MAGSSADTQALWIPLLSVTCKPRKLREYEKNKQLGWVPKAEIANGRWVMFGLLVGMLTEYSTGVNFIEQIKLLLVNLSIVDFD